MAYQYAKDRDLSGKESGADNAYEVLMRKLTRLAFKKPKKKSAQMLWAKSNHTVIEDEVRKHPQFISSKKGRVVGIRQKIIGNLFKELDDDDKKGWEEMAMEDHSQVLKDWKAKMDSLISNSPEDRQQ